jgi:nucleotide-binding universal stress UspA family protein
VSDGSLPYLTLDASCWYPWYSAAADVKAMSSVLLAVLDRADFAPRVLSAAACLAELTGSSLVNVLAVRTPPSTTILPSEEILSLRDELRIRDEERHRADALKGIYDRWAELAHASNTATDWFDVEGLSDQLVDEWGRRADFIVLSRPTDRQLDQERRAIHAALFNTDRPVLVVPPEPPPAPFGRRIAMAWRDDERTIKAVLSGLRCAARAEEIHVLAGTRDIAVPQSVPSILEEHGIAAKLHVLPIGGQQAFGEALLGTAHRLGADLLVMGAFARHPLRSLILGGVTRYMLAHADMPVLMRH